ncbi:MAG: hypothetical protein SVG88_02295 [Halobacteriales archaeon]|nr:hypothetical protein [Halobacteriales archaeon]
MRLKRLITAVSLLSDAEQSVECALCGTDYDEPPTNCQACGSNDFI